MTTRSSEALRLGVGLAHVVQGAEIRLATPDARTLIASAHPSSDVTLCDLREALLYSVCPHRPDVSRWIETTDICGSLQSRGGGVYRLRGVEPEQRWFSTLLRTDHVIEVLSRLECEEPLCGAVNAKLLPDGPLGVTAVCVSADDPRINIDEVAVILHGACLVSELIGRPDAQSPEFSRLSPNPTDTPNQTMNPSNPTTSPSNPTTSKENKK